jgi:hypothetical protein
VDYDYAENTIAILGTMIGTVTNTYGKEWLRNVQDFRDEDQRQSHPDKSLKLCSPTGATLRVFYELP